MPKRLISANVNVYSPESNESRVSKGKESKGRYYDDTTVVVAYGLCQLKDRKAPRKETPDKSTLMHPQL
jgi:hypothetical protein